MNKDELPGRVVSQTLRDNKGEVLYWVEDQIL